MLYVYSAIIQKKLRVREPCFEGVEYMWIKPTENTVKVKNLTKPAVPRIPTMEGFTHYPYNSRARLITIGHVVLANKTIVC